MNVKGTREGKDLQNKNKIIKKMPICVCVCVCVCIITLNVNGLNSLTKRHRLVEWIQKQDSYMLSTRDPLQT